MMIDIDNVVKSYHGAPALRDISLSVAKGEVVVLIGASGSGKSTLLRCINDLEAIDSGEIRVGDQFIGYERRGDRLVHQPDHVAAKHRAEVGMVFQNFNLFPHMTALGNVMAGSIHVRRLPKLEAKREALELLRRVRLSDKAQAYPSQLSGGQQQRVAIARALAMRPKVMLFDEPTSALDPETINEVLDVIRELADAGMTMMIATHEMAFAREVGDRVVFMSGGTIIEQAPVEHFFENPATEQGRLFLNSIFRKSGRRQARSASFPELVAAEA